MRIIVKDGEDNINLALPTGLVLNRLTAAAAARLLRKYGLNLTSRQITALLRAIKEYKRRHPEWTLVEVQDADGEYVLIRL